MGSPAVDRSGLVYLPEQPPAEVEQEQRRAERLAQKLRQPGVDPGTLS